MENFAAYTMLVLLAVQLVLFFVSVAYRLSLRQGDHASAEYKSSIWGGSGFLVMCANGLLASHYVNADQFLTTWLLSAGAGLLGALILWLGFYQRAHYIKSGQ